MCNRCIEDKFDGGKFVADFTTAMKRSLTQPKVFGGSDNEVEVGGSSKMILSSEKRGSICASDEDSDRLDNKDT